MDGVILLMSIFGGLFGFLLGVVALLIHFVQRRGRADAIERRLAWWPTKP